MIQDKDRKNLYSRYKKEKEDQDKDQGRQRDREKVKETYKRRR